MEWTFCCNGEGHRHGLQLTLEASDAQDAEQQARERGWRVDLQGRYPIVACSDECWQKSHDESSSPSRPQRRRVKLSHDPPPEVWIAYCRRCGAPFVAMLSPSCCVCPNCGSRHACRVRYLRYKLVRGQKP